MSPGPTKHISYPKGGLEMMDLLNKIKLLGQNFLPSWTSPKLLKVLTERLLKSLGDYLLRYVAITMETHKANSIPRGHRKTPNVPKKVFRK